MHVDWSGKRRIGGFIVFLLDKCQQEIQQTVKALIVYIMRWDEKFLYESSFSLSFIIFYFLFVSFSFFTFFFFFFFILVFVIISFNYYFYFKLDFLVLIIFWITIKYKNISIFNILHGYLINEGLGYVIR